MRQTPNNAFNCEIGLNTAKLATGKKTSQQPHTKEFTQDIAVKDIPIEHVSNFVYLGATISGNAG